MYPAATFVAVLLAVTEISYFWSKTSIRSLRAEAEIRNNRLFPGEKGTVVIKICNNRLVPAIASWLLPCTDIIEPMLETGLQDGQDNPVNSLNETGGFLSENNCIESLPGYIGSKSGLFFSVDFTAKKRGYMEINTLHLQSMDAFGFFKNETQCEISKKVIVYPKIINLDNLDFHSADFSGLRRDSRPYFFDPVMFVGLRDYNGDIPSRYINWKASAHKDKLLSKIIESSTSLRICIVVDIEPLVTPRLNAEEFEKVLSIAASIAFWADKNRIPFGLVSNAATACKNITGIVPVKSGADHLRCVLDILAMSEPELSCSIDKLFKTRAADIPWGTTLISIGNAERPPEYPSAIRKVVYCREADHGR